jgi:hypothetical protein
MPPGISSRRFEGDSAHRARGDPKRSPHGCRVEHLAACEDRKVGLASGYLLPMTTSIGVGVSPEIS